VLLHITNQQAQKRRDPKAGAVAHDEQHLAARSDRSSKRADNHLHFIGCQWPTPLHSLRCLW
jgi:hypothetical protein